MGVTSALSPESAGLTPCQRCCAPGGDCSAAFKGQPGKCCGTVGEKAFCCPGTFSTGAKCHNCVDSFRCFTGIASRSICGQASSHVRRTPYQYAEPHVRRDDGMSSILLVGIVAVVFILLCARQNQQPAAMGMPAMPMAQPVAYDQFGKPIAMGTPAMAVAPGYGGYGGHAGQGGYSGMAVAGSAATGFMGGMLVSEMMHSGQHHHHGGYSGVYGGGDYGGGGGDYGGGDYGGGGGGGDSGFASDS